MRDTELDERLTDVQEQEVVYELLLRIKRDYGLLTLVEATGILCESLDLDEADFIKNVGSFVLSKIKQDAEKYNLVKGQKRVKKTKQIDSLYK